MADEPEPVLPAQGETVEFAAHVKPLLRAKDRQSMSFGFDLWSYPDVVAHAADVPATPSPWLFPGGQPGRPISTARLTQRLNDLGIRPNPTRSSALFQLATQIPAAILARTLGIHTDVAVTWQRLSGGDWASYAAHVSQRTTPPAGGIPRV